MNIQESEISEEEIKKAFSDFISKITEERKLLRHTVLSVISISSKDKKNELNNARLQQLTEEFGDFGLKDSKTSEKTIREDFVSYSNLRKLHSNLLFSDKNLIFGLRQLFYANPDAAQKIIRMDIHGIIEKEILMFHDIPSAIDDRNLQKVLRLTDKETVVKALIGEPYLIKEKFFRNMSQRAAEGITEQMEKIIDTISDDEILKNRKKIIDIILKLNKEDQIFLNEKGSRKNQFL